MAFQVMIITKAIMDFGGVANVSVTSSIAEFDTTGEANAACNKLFDVSHQKTLNEFGVTQHITKLY